MNYIWDEKKNAANLAKHGVDFRDAAAIFERPVVVKQDTRKDYGEDRFRAIGALNGIIFTVVFTDKGEDTRRIISIRPSHRKERKIFKESIGLPD